MTPLPTTMPSNKAPAAPPPPAVDDSAGRFLDALFGDAVGPNHLISIFSLPSERTRFHASIQDAVNDALAREGDVYCGCALYRPGIKSGRGTSADVVGIVSAWADIDFGDGHKKRVPPDEATARAILARFPYPPSIIVRSGGGLHPWSLLKEPWLFVDGAEHDKAADFARRFVGTIQAHATAEGYVLDSVGDLARVLRVPGTFNYKRGTPVLVTIAEFNPDCRYEPDDFELIDVADNPAVSDSVRVGALILKADAKAPAEKLAELLEHDPRFRETWAHRRVDLGDKSFSGYDMALADRFVADGWSDQEIANGLIEHRSKYGSNEDVQKALRADYQRRTLRAARASGCRMDAGAESSPSPPCFEGPLGVTLTALSARTTPTKRVAVFTVAVGGKGDPAALDVSSSDAGMSGAVRRLAEIVKDHTGKKPSGKDTKALDKWLRSLLSPASVKRIMSDLGRIEASRPPPGDGKATMIEAVMEATMGALDLRFRGDDGTLWSERWGRSSRQFEFAALTCPEAIEAVKASRDFVPSETDPLKPIRCVKQVMPLAWTKAVQQLPCEANATGLGPDSKAAQAFRRALSELLTANELWRRIDNPPGTERTSLVVLARTRTIGIEKRWIRPVDSCDLWCRLLGGQVWLAIRYGLLNGKQIPRCRVPNVHSQRDLTTLLNRHGLAGEGDGGPPERIHGGMRFAIFSPEFSDGLCRPEGDDPEDADRPMSPDDRGGR